MSFDDDAVGIDSSSSCSTLCSLTASAGPLTLLLEDFDAFLWSRSRMGRPRNFRVRLERSSLWIETAIVEAEARGKGERSVSSSFGDRLRSKQIFAARK